MTNKNFYKEIDIIADERGLEPEDVLECVRVALDKACGSIGYTGQIVVEFQRETAKIKIVEIKTVVDEIEPEGPVGQILLEEAQTIKPKIKVGGQIKTEIHFAEITRKGAARFKNVFNQSLKELGNKRAYEFFKGKEGEMVTGRIVNVANGFAILNIGKGVRVSLPINEALPSEKLGEGQEMKVYITEVEESGKGPIIKVSRAHRNIIKRLFEQIVPEVSDGTIEVMNVARDPGSRTKVGVMSNDPTVDPKGTCIGIKGARIKEIMAALNGEKIDIFNWSDDPIKLIAESLTPSKVIAVLPDPETKKSIAIVPDEQFSLAIGKGGQNVRLACIASGWKIDIKDETTAYREGIRFRPNVR